MPYDPRLVQPMREELTRIGVQELTTAADVDGWMAQTSGTAMLVFNSVCGCAAGSARPGLTLALRHGVKPDRVATVFAGQDIEAVAKARTFLTEVPPSSPSIALFKDGVLVHFVPRHMIEGRDANGVAAQLTSAFDKHCVARAS
jgi:putative YphP/YqiW family bacilliredoxin